MTKFMAGLALALIVTLLTGGQAMGKGRIISGGTDGLYTIEVVEDRTRAESNRTTAVARVASIDTRISELNVDLADAQSVVDDAAAYQDQMIAAYQTALTDDTVDTAEARQDMTKAGEALIQAAAKRDAIARNIGALKSERLSVQKRIDLIDALPPLRQQEAWCADYTEDLAGDVATAEVPGEIGQVIIQPGYTDGAAWSPTDDGAIQPALSGTPAGVFYNLAMLPGWQKWRPTFRIATISNISNDLCDITLDAATSSQQGLGVNAQDSYSGVPIMYMDCNGDAFEDGDRVLVAFSGNTEQPMVVGFEKEPVPCLAFDFSVPLYRLGDISYDYFFAEAEIVGGDANQAIWEWTGVWNQLSDDNRNPDNYGVFHIRDFTVPKVNPHPAQTASYTSSAYQVDVTAQITLSDYSMAALSQSSTEKKEIIVEVTKDQVTQEIKLEVTTTKSVERFISPEGEPVGAILDHQSASVLTVDGQVLSNTIQGDAIPTTTHRPVTLRGDSDYDTFWFTNPTGADFDDFPDFFTVPGSVYTEAGAINVKLNVPVFPLFNGQSNAALGSHLLHIRIPSDGPAILVEG